MSNQDSSNSGIIRNFMDASQMVLDSFMEGVRYRFDLFEMELQEVSERYIKMYMLLQVAFFAIFIAFLCLNVLILVMFWEHRIPVSLGLFLFYIIAGLFLVRHVMQNAKSAPPPFSATIEVLKQDQVALMSENPVAFNKKANM
jgi:uncharacterized membrane protein YqjE